LEGGAVVVKRFKLTFRGQAGLPLFHFLDLFHNPPAVPKEKKNKNKSKKKNFPMPASRCNAAPLHPSTPPAPGTTFALKSTPFPIELPVILLCAR
jgi:hypothetical protein